MVTAQSEGADLLLRYPPQVTFTVWGEGATYNEILLEAAAGDALNSTLLVKVRGRDNALVEARDYVVTASLARADNVTLLGSLNGTILPGQVNDTRLHLNFTLPADLEPGAYELRFALTTGPWDPNEANNDPRPVPMQVGAFVRDAQPFVFHSGLLIGPALFGLVVVTPVAYRLAHRHPASRRALGTFHEQLLRLGDTWRQLPARLQSRISRWTAVAVLFAAFLTTVVVQRGLAEGTAGLQDALVLGALAGLVHLGAGTLGRGRRLKERQREAGRAPDELRIDWKRAGSETVVPALQTLAITFFAALFWQQLAAATTLFRWPDLSNLDAFFVIGLRFGAIYGLIALGYTMVYGVLKFINFAHGELFMWGAYFMWIFAVQGVLGWQSAFLVAVVLGLVFSGLLGATMERVAYRPLRGASRLAPLVTAIALSVFLQAAAQFFFGASTVTFTQSGAYRGSALHTFFGRDAIILGYRIDHLSLTVLVVSLLLLLALHLFIRHSRTGQAMRAVADDLQTARTLGIRVDRIISLTFVIGSVLAAVGGLFYGLRFGLSPTMGLLVGIKAFTAAVVGGIGNIHGAFLGGFLIGIAENVGSQFIDDRFQRVIAFVILVGFLLFRPRGIFPSKAGVERR